MPVTPDAVPVAGEKPLPAVPEAVTPEQAGDKQAPLAAAPAPVASTDESQAAWTNGADAPRDTAPAAPDKAPAKTDSPGNLFAATRIADAGKTTSEKPAANAQVAAAQAPQPAEAAKPDPVAKLAVELQQAIAKHFGAGGEAGTSSQNDGTLSGREPEDAKTQVTATPAEAPTTPFATMITQAATHVQDATPAAAPTATQTQVIVARLSEKIEQMKDMVPARTVTMRLDPPELGAIDVTVRARGSRIEASVVTENSWVRQALDSHRPQLVEQLGSRGLSLEALDVSTQGQERQTSQQPQSQGSRPDPIRATPATADLPSAATPRTTSLYSRLFDLEA